jgi:hypothetical protein
MAEEPTKLTVEDPVAPEVLKALADLRDSRLRIGDQVLDLEAEKVRLMVAVRQIDAEKQRTFEKILMDRGLPPTFPVEIDGQTGKIKPLAPVPQPKPEQAELPAS